MATKRRMIVLILLATIIVPVSAQEIRLPPEPKVGDTLTYDYNLYNERLSIWKYGNIWINLYYYPDGNDIESPYGGEWRHINTTVIGINYSIISCTNYSYYIDCGHETDFYLDIFEVSFQNISNTHNNITSGLSSEFDINSTLSEEELEEGVGIQFLASEMDNNLLGHELSINLNASISFKTVYQYWEWSCGGVVYGYSTSITDSWEILLVVLCFILGIIINNKIADWREKRKESEQKCQKESLMN